MSCPSTGSARRCRRPRVPAGDLLQPWIPERAEEPQESTRQRFIAIALGYPSPDVETEVVAHEAGSIRDRKSLVSLAYAIRNLDGSPLREVSSTRMLILAGGLVAEGLNLRSAVHAAVVQVLSDDADVIRALDELVNTVLPQT